MGLARLASRNDAVLEDGFVTLPVGVRGRDTRVILREGAQGADETVAKIGAQGQPFRIDDRTVRILQADVPNSRQRVDALVVDHLVGEQDIVVVINLDVAPGDDAIVAVVVNEVVGLQKERRRFVGRNLLRHNLVGGVGLQSRDSGLLGARTAPAACQACQDCHKHPKHCSPLPHCQPSPSKASAPPKLTHPPDGEELSPPIAALLGQAPRPRLLPAPPPTHRLYAKVLKI